MHKERTRRQKWQIRRKKLWKKSWPLYRGVRKQHKSRNTARTKRKKPKKCQIHRRTLKQLRRHYSRSHRAAYDGKNNKRKRGRHKYRRIVSEKRRIRRWKGKQTGTKLRRFKRERKKNGHYRTHQIRRKIGGRKRMSGRRRVKTDSKQRFGLMLSHQQKSGNVAEREPKLMPTGVTTAKVRSILSSSYFIT